MFFCFCFCITFPFSLCMMPFIISDFYCFWGLVYFPSCGVLECSIVHRGVLRFLWSMKLCVCVLIPIVLLGKKSLVGLNLTSFVNWSLHILRVLVYEMLWFLSIYVFLFLCYVSVFFVYDAFHNFWFSFFFRFFFSTRRSLRLPSLLQSTYLQPKGIRGLHAQRAFHVHSTWWRSFWRIAHLGTE